MRLIAGKLKNETMQSKPRSARSSVNIEINSNTGEKGQEVTSLMHTGAFKAFRSSTINIG